MASADLKLRTCDWTLPADARVSTAAAALTFLQPLLSRPSVVRVDGGQVLQADTATVQLLLYAQQELSSRGGRLVVASRSTALTDALQAAGAEAHFPSD